MTTPNTLTSIIAYHATTKDFFDFIPSHDGDYGGGIYLTDSFEGAQMYAKTRKGQEAKTVKILYFENRAGIDKDLLIKSLGFDSSYGIVNDIIYHIDKKGKQTKEQLTTLCQNTQEAWFGSRKIDEQTLNIINYFADKEVHLKDQPNPNKRERVLKVELNGFIVPSDKTPKEIGLPQLSLETLCKIHNISYPIQSKTKFIHDVLNKAQIFYLDNKEIKSSCYDTQHQLNDLLTLYNKPEENLSALLTKQAALSPNLEKSVKIAETFLRTFTENSTISYLDHNCANFCSLLKIDGLKFHDETFNLTYYLVKNPKICRITEYMDEKTNGQWKSAPKRPESAEEKLYSHFGMKKEQDR